MLTHWRDSAELRIGTMGLATIALIGVLGPLVIPLSPTLASLDVLHAPGAAHWLGTDDEGVDVAAKIAAGARLALLVGVGYAAMSVGLGTAIGMTAGYFGGRFDAVVRWLCDMLLCFPGLLLALLIGFVADRPGIGALIVALAATGWAGHARLARSLADSVRRRDFIVGVRCLGASHRRVLFFHVLPELAGPMLVQGTLAVATGVLAEASLSFLGLGPQGVASWGAMLEQGTAIVVQAPWVLVAAGLALLVLVGAVNLMGDGLRDLLDPRGDQQR
ncbi:MAG: ABC transporter permease [Myxococcales bacterium]|nr:ABC transporter permease [Myxococcales bacterium]